MQKIRVKEKIKEIVGYEPVWDNGKFKVGTPIKEEAGYGDMFEQ